MYCMYLEMQCILLPPYEYIQRISAGQAVCCIVELKHLFKCNLNEVAQQTGELYLVEGIENVENDLELFICEPDWDGAR